MKFDEIYSCNDFYFSQKYSEGMVECLEKYQVSPCKALDVGAGEGRNSLYLASQGFDVTAVEPSVIGAHKIATKSKEYGLKINVINSDIISSRMILSDIGFVVALTSFEHMEYDYMCKAICEIKKMMAIGGYIYIIVFTEEDPGFNKDFDNASECSLFVKHYFKKNELKEFFYNFEILEYSEYIKEDTTHGLIHYHGKAKLFARKKND